LGLTLFDFFQKAHELLAEIGEPVLDLGGISGN
jgi:hypothetical protein